MAAADGDWEARVASEWAAFEAGPDDVAEDAAFRVRIDALAAERPDGDGAALFERACARDSTGDEAGAETLYRAALAAGITGLRRHPTAVQLASTLRNLDRAEEGVALLEAERAAGRGALDDAVAACLALCLADCGREREAVGVAVSALAPHLPRYQRSMGRYAAELTG